MYYVILINAILNLNSNNRVSEHKTYFFSKTIHHKLPQRDKHNSQNLKFEINLTEFIYLNISYLKDSDYKSANQVQGLVFNCVIAIIKIDLYIRLYYLYYFLYIII